MSQERTFAHDLKDAEPLRKQLWQLSQEVGQRLRKAELAASIVAIKLRCADFTTLSRQMKLAVPTDDERTIYRAAITLLKRAWQHGRPVRLLGVTVRNLSSPAGQLPLL